jgi:hypothetical protein
MKYTLEELKEMLLEPSFDINRYDYWVEENFKDLITPFLELVELAIKHHEELSNDNNAEHQ